VARIIRIVLFNIKLKHQFHLKFEDFMAVREATRQNSVIYGVCNYYVFMFVFEKASLTSGANPVP
jgi:hypothetical protein